MSGGIAQLVAVGAQDAHLVGQPEISFFRSTYKRHTNFSQTVERQVIQGNVADNGMSTIRFERKGDLLSYVYLVPNNGSAAQGYSAADWRTKIAKVELLIGGQVIDDQDSTYSTLIAPVLSATNSSKSVAGDLFGGANTSDSTHSASLSAKTSKPPFPSLLSSTTTWNFALLGAPRLPPISGMSTPTMCTWIPKSVSSSPPTHKT
jgi:hypothetical protein